MSRLRRPFAPAVRTGTYRHTFAAKIALLTVGILVFLLSALSLVTYLRVEQVTIAREYEASLRVLRTTGTTIGEMHGLSRRIAVSIYMNQDVQHLMSESQDTDLYDILTRLTRLDSLRIYNPMIDSIIVYNGTTDTTFDTQKLIHADSNPFVQSETGELMPRLSPVFGRSQHPTSDQYADEWTEYFAYANYELEQDQVEQGIIVSIDAAWLISSVERIGDADNAYEMHLLDSAGQLLYGSQERASAAMDMLGEARGEEHGYVVGDLNGSDQLVVYAALDDPSWTVIMTRPLADLVGHIRLIRRSVLTLTAVFAVLAAFVAVGLARIIYRPISNIVGMLGPGEANAQWSDEFDFISHRLQAIREGQEIDKQTALSYQLFRLLSDSPRLASRATPPADFPFDLTQPIVVCVMKVDDVPRELADTSHPATSEAIRALAERAPDRGYVFAGANRYVLLANAPTNGDREMIAQELVALQRALWNDDEIPISVSVSEPVHDLRRLTAEYIATASRLRYTFIYGPRAVITPGRIAENEAMRFSDIRRTDLERRMLQSISQGDASSASRALTDILAEYRVLGVDPLVLALTLLVSRIRETMQEINDRRLEPSAVDFDELSDLPRSSATLDRFAERLAALIEEFVGSSGSSANPRHSVIVAHLLEAIQNDYTDPNLALKTLAADLGMSGSYVGHLFKERVGESFADYLKHYRLDRAAALFERNVEASVRDVMQEVGFDNESYFYRMFKTRFGVTPREYVLKVAVVSTRRSGLSRETGSSLPDEHAL